MKLLHSFLLLFIAFFISSCVHKVTVVSVKDMEGMQEVKIAMILPEKVIGRYAHTTSTAVFAYLLTQEHPDTLKTFQVEYETDQELTDTLDMVKEQGFEYVIAPVTLKGARIISRYENDLKIYFPTIHKNELKDAGDNIYFGAIDYAAQIEKLMPLSTSPLVIMYDKSRKGMQLFETTQKSYMNKSSSTGTTEIFTFAIDQKRTNLRSYLENNQKIQHATFFLNTPLIKSTMILSQFSVYETNVTNVLSTQINYDPLILTMTQAKDRHNLYIANSISIHNDPVIQANTLLSNDIVYDWINYASTVGVDYFYHRMTGEKRLYDLPVEDNQIVYPIAIMQPSGTHFKEIDTVKLLGQP